MLSALSEKDRQIIMAVPSNTVDRLHVGPSGFIPTPSARWLVASTCWVLRGPAEGNLAIMQVIPYILVTVGDRERGRFLLTYRRPGGGEGRLTGRRSAGFGGHVEYDDCGASDPEIVWKIAALRELREELTGLEPDAGRLRTLGLIDARRRPEVGEVERVHVGILMHYDADGQVGGDLSGDGTAETQWVRPAELPYLGDLECWSRVAADAIRDGGLSL